ncbi:MAG: AAA family ATPase [Lachnospiraceae bacterium]|nr:AAA family ATPase [Lachnospiraceae bacterium]
MKISYLRIKNFKSIRELEIRDIENALILVGKNNTGKTVVIDAIRLVAGQYPVSPSDYCEEDKNITIEMQVDFDDTDMDTLHQRGIVSKYKKRELWESEFYSKLPSFRDNTIRFKCVVNPQGQIRYSDGIKKNNPNIKAVIPMVYHIDQNRDLTSLENELLSLYDEDALADLRDDLCMFDKKKKCTRCFHCIGYLNKKEPVNLSVTEAEKLLEYKLLNLHLNKFADKVNRYFHSNGSASRDISYEVNYKVENMFRIETKVYNQERKTQGAINTLSEGLKSIYALSLLEAYVDEEDTVPCIIMMEDPEIYLHPQLQKTASEILYRLSKKNQVIFSTHSPNLIFNFSSKQIRQVMLDEEYYTVVKEETDVDEILDDLGYTANDLMNVSFVFIVEGKQDKNRLPLLLEKYYSEIYDENGALQRISIVSTNSCTNIKTYANLKYINKLYLKDQFLMIRDSDGKNPKYLSKQLCNYYAARKAEETDADTLPTVTPKNILILKYYSFENYFLDPAVMAKIGVIKNEDEFYNILYQKYKDYLYKLGSVKHMLRTANIRIKSKEDIKKNLETIRIYVRGHNLFDIFYAKYRHNGEEEILRKYIDAAPPETFADILQTIDSFVYFENRRK